MTDKEQKLCDLIDEILDWLYFDAPGEANEISEKMEDIINAD